MPLSAILAIINPAAGRGRAEARWRELRPLVAALTSTLVEHCTAGPGDAARRAADWAAGDGPGLILAVGGDGTVHEIVNGLHAAKSTAPLAVIPAGTGNDFVRNLGPPREPRALLCRLGVPGRRCDLGRLELDTPEAGGGTVVFVNSASVGVSAVANRYAQRLKRLAPGRWVYTAAGARALLGPHPDFTVTTAEGKVFRQPLNFTIANGATFGGGMRIAPDAVPDDGRLEQVVIGEMAISRALAALSRLRGGGHVGMAEVLAGAAGLPAVIRAGPVPLELEADGQDYLVRREVRVSILPGALEVAGA